MYTAEELASNTGMSVEEVNSLLSQFSLTGNPVETEPTRIASPGYHV